MIAPPLSFLSPMGGYGRHGGCGNFRGGRARCLGAVRGVQASPFRRVYWLHANLTLIVGLRYPTRNRQPQGRNSCIRAGELYRGRVIHKGSEVHGHVRGNGRSERSVIFVGGGGRRGAKGYTRPRGRPFFGSGTGRNPGPGQFPALGRRGHGVCRSSGYRGTGNGRRWGRRLKRRRLSSVCQCNGGIFRYIVVGFLGRRVQDRCRGGQRRGRVYAGLR